MQNLPPSSFLHHFLLVSLLHRFTRLPIHINCFFCSNNLPNSSFAFQGFCRIFWRLRSDPSLWYHIRKHHLRGSSHWFIIHFYIFSYFHDLWWLFLLCRYGSRGVWITNRCSMETNSGYVLLVNEFSYVQWSFVLMF